MLKDFAKKILSYFGYIKLPPENCFWRYFFYKLFFHLTSLHTYRRLFQSKHKIDYQRVPGRFYVYLDDLHLGHPVRKSIFDFNLRRRMKLLKKLKQNGDIPQVITQFFLNQYFSSHGGNIKITHHPLTGKYIVIDGNGRVYCLQQALRGKKHLIEVEEYEFNVCK